MEKETKKARSDAKTTARRWVLTLVVAAAMLGSIAVYLLHIQQQIYAEGARATQELYEQVNKTFTMFAQRNWNVLMDWGSALGSLEDPESATRFRNFDEEREIWNYSDFYMVNENWQYWTVAGRQGVGLNIRLAFEQMYASGQPTVASYTATSGKRKVVFMVPCEPITMDGVTYTSLAVSYDNDAMAEMIGGRAYGGRSDCYIIYPDGGVMLAEEAQSEITAWMENLFDYLEQNAQYDAAAFAQMKEEVARGGSGCIQYCYQGKCYYLVYQPVGFQNLTMVGIVERNVVDAGMRRVQYHTILLLVFLAICVMVVLVYNVKTNARLRLAEREGALDREAEARRQMENLANTDGLTGLCNERYFNQMLKEKERTGEPFALFYLDLDRFKPINDTYGHDVGDQLLKEVAARLQRCVRKSDYAFRIGGDEFALMVNGRATEEFCRKRIETIREAICEPVVLGDKNILVGTSCGFALYPQDSDDVRAVRILADHRMYEDKAERKAKR